MGEGDLGGVEDGTAYSGYLPTSKEGLLYFNSNYCSASLSLSLQVITVSLWT